MRVGREIAITDKTDFPIVTALDDVLGNSCSAYPWQSGHTSSLMMVNVRRL
jgi:hypothetical protein